MVKGLTRQQAHRRLVIDLQGVQVLAYDELVGLPAPTRLKPRVVAYADAVHMRVFRDLKDVERSSTLIPAHYDDETFPHSAKLARALGFRRCS